MHRHTHALEDGINSARSERIALGSCCQDGKDYLIVEQQLAGDRRILGNMDRLCIVRFVRPTIDHVGSSRRRVANLDRRQAPATAVIL